MKFVVCLLASLCCFSVSNAAEVAITAVPTGWLLENSVGGYINAYYTGTTCPGGRLRLETGITEQDKNRFWSMIMAAKMGNLSVTVWYDPTLADCQLTRFRLNAGT